MPSPALDILDSLGESLDAALAGGENPGNPPHWTALDSPKEPLSSGKPAEMLALDSLDSLDSAKQGFRNLRPIEASTSKEVAPRVESYLLTVQSVQSVQSGQPRAFHTGQSKTPTVQSVQSRGNAGVPACETSEKATPLDSEGLFAGQVSSPAADLAANPGPLDSLDAPLDSLDSAPATFDYAELFERLVGIPELGFEGQAEDRALAGCINQWLTLNPPPASSDKACACCGGSFGAHDYRPHLTRGGFVWLHADCWPTWWASEIERGRQALAVMGIEARGGWND